MSKAVQLIKEHDVKWVDLRFTDTKGKQHHVTMPARDALDEDFFEHGKMFDGSSIHGWKGIEASDMILMPVDDTAVLDPFTEEPTLILVCDIIEPSTMQGYDRDPRSIAKRAEEFLKTTGIGDTVFVGPEPEFFIFDEVKFKSDISGSMFKIYSEQGSWMTDVRPRPRNPYCHVQRHGRNGPGHRSSPPRSGHCRSKRNRREVQHPGRQG
jgi:glutamine synthetase